MPAPPIQQRIRAAFQPGERELHFYELALRVFPTDQFPRAFRYSSNGGPPGCAMALSATLRRMGLASRYEGPTRYVSRPSAEDTQP